MKTIPGHGHLISALYRFHHDITELAKCPSEKHTHIGQAIVLECSYDLVQ